MIRLLKTLQWFAKGGACAFLAAYFFCGPAVSQESDLQLPPHAVWRQGEHDHSPDSNGIYRLQFSRDGKFLATRNRKNVVAIYNVDSQRKLCEVDGHDNNWVATIDFSPDSKYFVTAAGANEFVKIWNTQTGKLVAEIDTDAASAFFNDAGDTINVLGESDVESYSWPGIQVVGKRKWRSDNESRIAMSRDGRIVVMARQLPRQIYQTQILDLDTKSKIELNGPLDKPKAVAISTNRRWLAVAFHLNDRVQLWDLRDPHNKKYILAAHEEPVQSLSFSPDNRFLISSSWDETVVAWDLLTRQRITKLDGHTEHANATAFSPSKLIFASGASGVTDCSFILWDMSRLLLPPPDKDPEFEKIWHALGANLLKSSLKASAALVAAGDPMVDLVEERLGNSVIRQTLGTTEISIERLGHPDFEIRQQATEQLIRIRPQIEPQLREAAQSASMPEVRYRLSKILKSKIVRPSRPLEELRRMHRLIFSLEMINTQRSQRLLEKIAAGHQDIDISQDARDSFRRNENGPSQ